MRETWLKPNRRVFAVAMFFAVALALVGLAVLIFGYSSLWLFWTGLALAIAGTLVAAASGLQMVPPRIAYEDGFLLLRLKSGEPIRVPIEIVEVFFFGQGDASAPGMSTSQSANVVVRLAEKAEDWKRREVHPRLANWCDGYITIRGDWCEQITEPVMRRLNAQLAEAHRQRRAARDAAAASTDNS
ncbi:MAG: hypothetical protein NXI22_26080 [bacterium]|nr:hypothetical protein [bacterium]